MYEYRLESITGNLAGTIIPVLVGDEWQYEATPVTQWNGEPDQNACTWYDSFGEAKDYIGREYSAACDSYAEGLIEDMPFGFLGNPEWEPTPIQSSKIEDLSEVLSDIGQIIARKAH